MGHVAPDVMAVSLTKMRCMLPGLGGWAGSCGGVAAGACLIVRRSLPGCPAFLAAACWMPTRRPPVRNCFCLNPLICSQGMRVRPDGPQLISELIRKELGLDCR